MDHTVTEIFDLLAQTSKIHDEIVRLRNDIERFIDHSDYVLPVSCVDNLAFARDTDLHDAQENMQYAIVALCTAMRSAKNKTEEKEDV